MAESLSLASVIEANRLSSEVAFLCLLDVEVVDPATGVVAQVLRIANNTEDVSFQGYTYTAGVFDISMKTESGKSTEVTLTVNDYTQGLMGLLEAYGGGIGSNVTFYLVNSGNLAQGPEVVEYFQVIGTSSTEYTHSFTLGAENALMQTFPRRRQTRDYCQWQYKSFDCGYGVTKMYRWKLTSTDITGRLHQVFTPTTGSLLTLSAYVYFDTSDTVQIEVYNVTSTTARNAKFKLNANGTLTATNTNITASSYAKLGTNFYRVWIQMTIPGGEAANTFHVRLFPANKSGLTTGAGLYMGGVQLEYGSISAPTVYQDTAGTVGSTNKILRSNDLLNASWVKTVATNDATTIYVPGPNIGPLATCDLTLQGPNGCAAHNNTVNFGAYPGLNSNGYRYA